MEDTWQGTCISYLLYNIIKSSDNLIKQRKSCKNICRDNLLIVWNEYVDRLVLSAINLFIVNTNALYYAL